MGSPELGRDLRPHSQRNLLKIGLVERALLKAALLSNSDQCRRKKTPAEIYRPGP